jgi:hydrogenase maturation protein HypF
MNTPPATRLKIAIRGAVQGVGFRPFIFRLATGLRLTGWVNNSPQGVFLEVEGPRPALEQFLARLDTEKPPRSFIQSLEPTWLDPVGFKEFAIRPSETGGDKTALVLPDIATCPDCLREILDPRDRRYRYPFTNCTNCGPRFSIIESLPYDRVNTSMRRFTMCPQCQAEYDDPHNRRFHAQPNACPVCGPRLEFWRGGAQENAAISFNPQSQPRSAERSYEALLAAVVAIREGKIVAVKGLGGFHLLADARNEQAVQRLRERKHREEKPFALMFPCLESLKLECEVSPLEERLLRSPESPIVLLRKIAKRKSSIVNAVAPGNPHLGVMLPYTPLHHLLLAEMGFPVVATSGNLSDEPICTDEHEACERLNGIADGFLVHNRPIVRHVDDSIVRVMLDRELVLRRARGYAPLPILIRSGEWGARETARGDRPSLGSYGPAGDRPTESAGSKTVLAVGAHLKNTVALSIGPQVFISQHIGDLETESAYAAFRRVISDFERLYQVIPQWVAADLHPDYLSTKYARDIVRSSGFSRPGPPEGGTPNEESQAGSPRYVGVQHHVAHVLSCMAENEISPPALGVSWDGTGFGWDATIWGGEFFGVTDEAVERVAHLRSFRLPGGEKAVKEPRRAALGLLHQIQGDAVFEREDLPMVAAFSAAELAVVKTMLAKNLNSPVTSSMGRLFDGVASLVGLRQQIRFEGQAAMELEFALEGVNTDEAYELPIADCRLPIAKTMTPAKESTTGNRQPPMILDWCPMISAILTDVTHGVPTGFISAKFHNALAEVVVAVARQAGEARVVLSGGCFQNRYLTERTARHLQAAGFCPYWHQRVPPNDGGISLGQIIAALRASG